MANPGWYNDNQFREYPFITRTSPTDIVVPLTGVVGGIAPASSASGTYNELIHSVIVDFGCILEIDSGFDEGKGDFVYLESIERNLDVFYFTFRNTANDAPLVFQRLLDAGEFHITWQSSASTLPDNSDLIVCPQNSIWSGFLVTGDLTELTELLTLDEVIYFTPGFAQIEPSCIQNLSNSYLRSVTLVNTPRSTVDAAPGCELSSSVAIAENPITQQQCIVGPVRFKEGYNCIIRQDNGRNTITIGAGLGLGEGEPCDEVKLFPEEKPPGDSPYLSGGPGCNEILKSINGVSGAAFNLIAGPGYRITPDQEQTNKLIVERALSDFALCATPDPTVIADCVNFLDRFVGMGTLSSHNPTIDPSGEGWDEHLGNVSLLGGAAQVTGPSSPGPLRTMALMSTGHSNAILEVNINFDGNNTGFSHGLVYRWDKITNEGWLLSITPLTNYLNLWYSDGSEFILIQADAFAVELNTTYRLRMEFEEDRHVGKVFDGNTTVAQITHVADGRYKNNTHHGIRGGFGAELAVEFDNFTQCIGVDVASSSASLSSDVVVVGELSSEVLPSLSSGVIE